jgi:hypothetical protein
MQCETWTDYLALVCELTTSSKLRINVGFENNFTVGFVRKLYLNFDILIGINLYISESENA